MVPYFCLAKNLDSLDTTGWWASINNLSEDQSTLESNKSTNTTPHNLNHTYTTSANYFTE